MISKNIFDKPFSLAKEKCSIKFLYKILIYLNEIEMKGQAERVFRADIIEYSFYRSTWFKAHVFCIQIYNGNLIMLFLRIYSMNNII